MGAHSRLSIPILHFRVPDSESDPPKVDWGLAGSRDCQWARITAKCHGQRQWHSSAPSQLEASVEGPRRQSLRDFFGPGLRAGGPGPGPIHLKVNGALIDPKACHWQRGTWLNTGDPTSTGIVHTLEPNPSRRQLKVGSRGGFVYMIASLSLLVAHPIPRAHKRTDTRSRVHCASDSDAHRHAQPPAPTDPGPFRSDPDGSSKFKHMSPRNTRWPLNNRKVPNVRACRLPNRHGPTRTSACGPHRLDHRVDVCAREPADVLWQSVQHRGRWRDRRRCPRADDERSMLRLTSSLRRMPSHVDSGKPW